MNWKLLLDNKCPIDNLKLIEKEKGFACPLGDEYNPILKCNFFITKDNLAPTQKKIQEDIYGLSPVRKISV